ncbi:MAG: hypothetical protein KGH49_01125 [Candidatus Micrarchaeota archaeon]|nr:hypothetical protein [Candidatus Micrarchaeota archaeon]
MRALAYFKALYKSKLVLATTALLAIIYYYAIQYLIFLSSYHGAVFVTVPAPMLYLLAISGAVLLTISIHSIKLARSKLETESVGIASAVTTVVGGFVAGCSCTVPLLSSLLYLFALDALAVGSIISFIAAYQLYIFAALILLNILLSYYHLHKMSGSCTLKNGRIVRLRR